MAADIVPLLGYNVSERNVKYPGARLDYNVL